MDLRFFFFGGIQKDYLVVVGDGTVYYCFVEASFPDKERRQFIGDVQHVSPPFLLVAVGNAVGTHTVVV